MNVDKKVHILTERTPFVEGFLSSGDWVIEEGAQIYISEYSRDEENRCASGQCVCVSIVAPDKFYGYSDDDEAPIEGYMPIMYNTSVFLSSKEYSFEVPIGYRYARYIDRDRVVATKHLPTVLQNKVDHEGITEHDLGREFGIFFIDLINEENYLEEKEKGEMTHGAHE